jgi:hypothetical protein
MLSVFPLGACPEPEPLVPGLEWCSGGEDEDLDGAADCEDPDCEQHVLCRQAFVQFDELSERYGWVLPEGTDLVVHGSHSGGDLEGDVNGDGKPDLALSLYWQPNPSTGDDSGMSFTGAALVQRRGSSNSGAWVPLQEEATRLSGSDGMHVGRIESGCDIDGDGYDDVVTAATVPYDWDFAAGDFEAVHIAFGRQKWLSTNPDGGAPVIPTLGLRLSAEFANGIASLSCMGDVDGDGRDDVLVGYNTEGAFWLSPEHLADGKLLPEVGYRWNVGGVPVGDLDGDGWVELRNGVLDEDCGDPLEFLGVGRLWKGGPQLAPQNTTLPADAWNSPPSSVLVCADEPERLVPPSGDGQRVWFHDLSGDGRTEILVDFGHEYLDLYDGTALGDLSIDVRLRRIDVVARMRMRDFAPAQPAFDGPVYEHSRYRAPSTFEVKSAGDIDGDGAIDLLVNLGLGAEFHLDLDRCPVCYASWYRSPHSWAVYFGTPGDLSAFERPWYAMDALMGRGSHPGMAGGPLATAATIIEDSDGDGMREILFFGSAAVSAADLDDPFLLPTAGVMPGSALSAWKIE